MRESGVRFGPAIRLAVALLLALLLAGCGSQGGKEERAVRQPVEPGKLKLGYSGSSALIGLQKRGDLEARLAALPQAVAVEWLRFDDDASLFRAIEDGRVDIGSVGDAVPAFLHREEAPLVYLAAEPANPSAYAIIAPLDSSIYAAADLKGKRVAYANASNEHLLLLEALDSAGLSAADVKPVDLAPADTFRSVEGRKADAWAIGEPELSRTEPLGVRIIATGELSPASRDIYVATPESMEGREELFGQALDAIGAYDDWLNEQYHDAAELLYQETGILHARWLSAFERKAYGTAPMLESIVREQQLIADTVRRLGGRQESIDVKRFIK